MTAFAKFVHGETGRDFVAVVDLESMRWQASSQAYAGEDLKMLNESLNELAPLAANIYAAEERDNFWSPHYVIRPYGWIEAIRLQRYYPDGEVVIYYEDDGERDLVY
jgi:hypothetical protein